MSEPWLLGVDFGTTTTAAATRSEGQRQGEMLRFGDAYRLSSAVLLEDDRVVAGSVVEREGQLHPTHVERCPKRQLGQGPVLVGDTWVEDTHLVGAVLRTVWDTALAEHDGIPPARVVLTHPAAWERPRRDAFVRAAGVAGIETVTLLPEPVAAALAVVERDGHDHVEEGDVVAVFDFGGGTLDIALLRRAGEGWQPVGPGGGDDRLGGETINALLVRYLAGQLSEDVRDRLLDPDSSDDVETWVRAAYTFAAVVRHAKEGLRERPMARMSLGDPFGTRYLELSEQELNREIAPLVRRAADLLEATIRRSGFAPQDLRAIYLAGGSSQLALVARVLGPRFGVRLRSLGDPKALVARGAVELPWAGGPTAARRDPLPPVSSVGPSVGRSTPSTPASAPTRTSEPQIRVTTAPARAAESAAAPTGPARREAARWTGPEFSLRLQDGPGWPDSTQAETWRLERWLVEVGSVVEVFTPLALMTPGSGGGPVRTYLSRAHGVVSALYGAAGDGRGWGDPLLALARVTTMCLTGGAPVGHQGVEVVLRSDGPAERGTPRFARASLWLHGTLPAATRRPVALGWRYALFADPGRHLLQVGDESRGAQLWVDVLPGRFTRVTYHPPATPAGPGSLTVAD